MHDPSDKRPASNGEQSGDAAPGTGDSSSAGGDDACAETFIKKETSLVEHDETIDEKGSAKAASARVAVDAPPSEFGRYRILKELGRGAMGAVYLAEDEQLGRKVALKIPQFDGAVTDAQLARFYREARSAGNLRHSGICPVYDVGCIGSQHYISMAFIEGRPLRDFSKGSRRQDGKSVAHIVRKIALAMAEAHEQSVIHRDLKPANVMIDTKNEPVVMDFGLARRVVEDEEKLTHTGTLIGTPAYMSPEQVDGDNSKVGPSADIYSLGVIFYELLTGELPFQGSLLSILKQIATKEPRPPVELYAEIDPVLGDLCFRMLAKKIEDRPDSMKAVARALSTWLQNMQVRTNDSADSVSANEKAGETPGNSPDIGTGPQVASAVDPPPLVIDTMPVSAVELRSSRSHSGKKYGALIAGTIGCFAVVVASVAFFFPAANDSPKSKVASSDSKGPSLEPSGLPESGEQVSNNPESQAKAPPIAVAPFDLTAAQNHQRLWAQYLDLPIEREFTLPGPVPMSLMLVPPGEFLMGSSAEQQAWYFEQASELEDAFASTVIPHEGPQHRVRITEPFYLGKLEVTQAQWWTITKNNPSHFPDPNLPVERVSHEDVQGFMDKLNELYSASGISFALPTEAQWEYACRAGTTSAWHFDGTEENVQEYGWVMDNATGTSHVGGELQPNPFGIHDLHGNLWEWCADWFEPEYSPSDVDDPRGPLSGEDRVFRGGCWGGAGRHCRSAYRSWRPPSDSSMSLGFRVAMKIEMPIR